VSTTGSSGGTTEQKAADTARSVAGTPAERAGAAQAHPDAPQPSGRDLADKGSGTETPAGSEPGTSGQGPQKEA
jgi:NADH-quinone oxidoreductase subunit E